MRKEKRQTTTVTVRLTDEEYEILRRLCALKRTSQTGYLTHLATSQAKKELPAYAVGEYQAGRASFSELAKKTGLDVPTIMEEAAKVTGDDNRAVAGFLSAVKTLGRSGFRSDRAPSPRNGADCLPRLTLSHHARSLP